VLFVTATDQSPACTKLRLDKTVVTQLVDYAWPLVVCYDQACTFYNVYVLVCTIAEAQLQCARIGVGEAPGFKLPIHV
jgi:hypothetical protein